MVSLSFPSVSPTFMPKVSVFTSVIDTLPAAEKAGSWEMTTMRCFRFLWHQLPEPKFNSALGQLRESIWGALGKQEGDAEWSRKPEWEIHGPGKLPWNQEITPSLQTLPADLQPCCPRETHLFLLHSTFLEDKDTMLLAPQTLWQSMSQKLHSIQKRGEKNPSRL